MAAGTGSKSFKLNEGCWENMDETHLEKTAPVI